MKTTLSYIFLFLLYTTSSAQTPDSAKFNVISDSKVGHLLPDIELRDTSGNTVRLSSFKGKVLYLDFWSTTCAPCIKLFPHEELLMERLKVVGLDTNVVVIKICGDSPADEWKSIIRTQNSKVINLILPGKDYKLFRRYDLRYYPTYHLVGADFRYLGTNIFRPNDINIDYYLFRAVSGTSFINAIKELHRFNAGIEVPVWYNQWKERQKPVSQ
jgi:thiol-disulfide isomerase/thioredoxin